MHALAFFFIALAQVSFAVLSALQCDNCNRGQIDKVAQLESNNTFKDSQLVVGQISYSKHTIFLFY